MTELNVPPWAFFIIWMTLIMGGLVAGWFLRGLWDKEKASNTPPPEEDERDFGSARRR